MKKIYYSPAGLERYNILASNNSHGVETKIELGKREKQIVWVTVQYKGLGRIGGADQADIFNLTQNSQNTVVHLLKVDEE